MKLPAARLASPYGSDDPYAIGDFSDFIPSEEGNSSSPVLRSIPFEPAREPGDKDPQTLRENPLPGMEHQDFRTAKPLTLSVVKHCAEGDHSGSFVAT